MEDGSGWLANRPCPVSRIARARVAISMATDLSPATPTIAGLSATPLACPRCGTAPAATARFCANCGYALFAPPPVPPTHGHIVGSLRTLKRIFAAFMRFLGRLFASFAAAVAMWIAVLWLLARFALDDKDSELTLGIPAMFLWLGLAAMFG